MTRPARSPSTPRRGWAARGVILGLCVACGGPIARADGPPATFYRGLNLNGPPVVIDGHRWDGKDAADYATDDYVLDQQEVPLFPATDPERARMIRSSVWGNDVDVALTNVPDGTYTVFLYVWENNNAVDFRVALNGETVVERYDSRSAGHWERLGPWVVTTADGTIRLTSSGGDANFSGIEVWSGAGPVPAPDPAEPDAIADEAPSPEGLEFFEKKVRPVLAKHCYACHGADAGKVKGGLALDSRVGMRAGGDSGPAVVPGNPEESLLLAAVRHEEESLKMPPEGKLTDAEVADLEAWVKMGAPDPRDGSAPAAPALDVAAAREFWSYRPIEDRPAPAVSDPRWPRTEIDRFILAKLEEKGLAPAPPADKRTLIRRATFDLIGLPPTPEEIEAFLADDAPDAFARVVDRLLASPHHGERWGRHWLDVARYADTSGCNSDFPVPTAYLYRNYVIDAFNADMPYDRFVREQVAGDLLPHASEAERFRQIIATGYLAIGRRFGSLADEFHLTIEDNIDNLGKAALGLSVSCARCHDHKFDPIPQRDYYALYGIFESTRYAFPGTEIPPQPKDFVPLVSPEMYEEVVGPFERELARLTDEMRRLEKLKEAIRLGKRTPEPGETPTLQEATLAWDAAKQERAAFLAKKPSYTAAYAVAEGRPADARLQKKGDPRQPGERVPRGPLQVLGGQTLPDPTAGSGRLELARWLTDPGNPLTARVMVNRVWQHHFGRGIVATPNDFGARGAPPTHPELLDHLAARFVAGGWSIKAMHRLIMNSSVYQMACVEDSRSFELDPKDERLWTFPRRRLSAEELRDAMLAVGGRLDPSPGGAHPFPGGEFKFTQHNPFLATYETDRRGVYLMQQRIRKHPFLEVFDGADPNATTPQRPFNTTPIQALFAMNDPLVHRLADAFARRLAAEAPDERPRVDRAYRLAYGRPPTREEAALTADYLRACRAAMAEATASPDDPSLDAWASLARALFCSNEFSFVD